MDAARHEADVEVEAAAIQAKQDAKEAGGAATPAAPLTRDGRMAPGSAMRMLAMQRTAGNRATNAALRASKPVTPVQRTPGDGGEQLGVASEELPQDGEAAKAEDASKIGGAGAAAGAGGGAGAGDAGDGGAAAGGGGAGAAAGGAAGAPVDPAASKVAAEKIADAGKVAGASKVTDGASKADGASKVTEGASKLTDAGKAAGASKVLDGASKADGASKVLDGASKADGASKVTEGASKLTDAGKAAGASKLLDGASKAGGASKVSKVAEAAKSAAPQKIAEPVKKALPAAAKKAAAVKTPSPVAPQKRAALNFVPGKTPADFVKVVAPPLPAAPGESMLGEVETAGALEQHTVQRNNGGPSTATAGTGGSAGGAAAARPMNELDAPAWGDWSYNDLISGGRTVLEIGRFIPGWGLFAGVAADLAGGVQDIYAIPPGEYPITEGLIYIRSALNVVNGAVGHLLYVSELIQDGLTGSVVLAEFVPLSAGAIEIMAAIKVGLDAGIFWADLGVEIGALWNQSHSSPDQWGAWQKIIDGYQANLAGDVISLVLDTITLASAGATNVDTIQAGTGIFNTAALLAQGWGDTLISFVMGMWNVWGGDAPGVSGEQTNVGTRPPPGTEGAYEPGIVEAAGGLAQAAAMRQGAGWLMMQSAEGRAAWEVVDAGIGLLQEEAAKKMAELDAMVMALSGGKTLWEVVHEGSMAAIGEMREKLANLQELQTAATDAEANGSEVKAWAEDVLSKIDAFTVPAVRATPAADYGDNMIADAAEWVADNSEALRVAALNAVIDQIRTTVDDVKAELKSPVEGVRDKAAEIGEFFALVAQVSSEQTASIDAYIAQFERDLGSCTGFEDAINVIIAQVTGMLGAPSFKIEDIRVFWRSLPGYFDQVDTLAANLLRRAAQLEQAASVQLLPEEMAPPADPEDENNDDNANNAGIARPAT